MRGSFTLWPMTPAVKKLLIILASIWLGEALLAFWIDSTLLVPIVDHFALTPVTVFPGLEVWQLFTYMWLHEPSGFGHIFANGLFLWMFGGALELSWGTRAFWRFYLTCGVGAGAVVLFSGLMFAPQTAVLGASGAIYGLVAAWALSFPNRMVYIFGVFPIKGKHFALLPIGYALIEFITRAPGVSHAAHLGGLAVGALLVTGYWRPQRAINRYRLWRTRRSLTVIQGSKDENEPGGPPGGGFWH